jgi:RNA-binding protein 25
MRKSKDYDREKAKEERKKLEEEEERRKLKEFLEDYDDERFDSKYYKGNNLSRRLRDREIEVTADENEREQEKKELEDLRNKLAEEGHPDPDSEVRKRLLSGDNERDRNNKVVSDRIRALMLEARQKSGALRIGDEDISMGSDGTPKEEIHVKTFGFAGMKLGTTSANNNNNEKQNQASNANTPDSTNDNINSGHIIAGGDMKRKKLSVSDVFNSNEDDDLLSKSKKRKLPTLVDDNTDSNLSTPSNVNVKIAAGDNKALTSEDKRKQIKALIEKIPTSKEELFKYEIEWSLVDNVCLQLFVII